MSAKVELGQVALKFNRSAEIHSFQTEDECAEIIPTSVGKLSQENFPTFYESGAARETTGLARGDSF